MKITESRLRRIIRSVITESMGDFDEMPSASYRDTRFSPVMSKPEPYETAPHEGCEEHVLNIAREVERFGGGSPVDCDLVVSAYESCLDAHYNELQLVQQIKDQLSSTHKSLVDAVLMHCGITVDPYSK